MIGGVREVSAEQMVIKLALGFWSFAESAKQNSFTVCVGLGWQIPKSLVKLYTVKKKQKQKSTWYLLNEDTEVCCGFLTVCDCFVRFCD